jgi:hypothetical protein
MHVAPVWEVHPARASDKANESIELHV